MKNFKYLFLVVGCIYLIEVIYAFIKPSTSYEILSFKVPFWGFIAYRLFFGVAFIVGFKRMGEK
ncbi:MAG: hypothetical protein RLZZ306_901 [Bacteroidota bacterium]|jgi:hypothetical protein